MSQAGSNVLTWGRVGGGGGGGGERGEGGGGGGEGCSLKHVVVTLHIMGQAMLILELLIEFESDGSWPGSPLES